MGPVKDGTTNMGVLSRPAPGVSRPDDGFTDYSAELKISRSRPFRWIYASLGMLCVGAGIIGVFLPGWPTTIWLLIAAWLFSRSSPRFYNRILNHRIFGPIVRDYRAGNGVPSRIKLIAIRWLSCRVRLCAPGGPPLRPPERRHLRPSLRPCPPRGSSRGVPDCLRPRACAVSRSVTGPSHPGVAVI